MNARRLFWLDVVAVMALVVVAAVPRLRDLESAGELKGDEAIEYTLARAIARDGHRPAVGLPTTEGPRVPPHRLYLFAIPLTVGDGPLAVMRFVALLNVAGCVAAYLAGRRPLGRRAALAFALVLATAPALVRSSRAVWGPHLLPPLAVGVVLLTLRSRRSLGAAAGVLPLAALAAHVHYAAVGLAAGAVALALRRLARGRPALFALSVGGAALVAAPFLLHELRTDFKETRASLGVAGKRDAARPPFERLEILARTFERLAPTAATEGLGPADETEARANGVGPLALAGAAALGVLLVAGAAARRGTPGLDVLALAAAAWLPFVALGLPPREHYALPAAAPLAALAGLGAAALARRHLGVGALLVAFLAVSGVVGTGSARAVLVRNGGSLDGDADVAMGHKLDAVRALVKGDLALGEFPRFEYVLLLDEALRELERQDPLAAEARWKRARYPDPYVRYWLDDVKLPVPRQPRGIARIVVVGNGAPPVAGEAMRFGPLVVVVGR